MAVRAIRGATQLDADEAGHLLERVVELVGEVLARNGLTSDDVISVLLSATPDLSSEFPAKGARLAGLHDVPVMSVREMDVPGALPRAVRLMAHVEVDRPRSEMRHVFLHGARALRPDLAEDADA
jgi:chorismate mutase